MNNGVVPRDTGGFHWLEYKPGFAYCFLPSLEADRGTPEVYSYVPEILKDYLFHYEIEKVRKNLNFYTNSYLNY